MQCDIFQEYDYATRSKVMAKYNLSREQSNLLVKAYDALAQVGGLLFRSDVTKEEIRYMNDNHYETLPEIMRTIIYKIPKDDFHKYFSPFVFKKMYEKFVDRVMELKIRNGAQILGVGMICYKKMPNVEFEQTEYS